MNGTINSRLIFKWSCITPNYSTSPSDQISDSNISTQELINVNPGGVNLVTVHICYYLLLLGLIPLLLSLLTVTGNMLVIVAIATNKKLRRKLTSILILNLAVADLLVGAVVMPLAMVLIVTSGKWVFGRLLCRIWISLDVICSTASIVTLCVISVDRFVGVMHPLRYQTVITRKRLIFSCIAVWIFSLSVLLGTINYAQISGGFTECQVGHELRYVGGSTIFSFFVPLAIILCVYHRIYQVTKRREEGLMQNAAYAMSMRRLLMKKTVLISSSISKHSQDNQLEPVSEDETTISPTTSKLFTVRRNLISREDSSISNIHTSSARSPRDHSARFVAALNQAARRKCSRITNPFRSPLSGRGRGPPNRNRRTLLNSSPNIPPKASTQSVPDNRGGLLKDGYQTPDLDGEDQVTPEGRSRLNSETSDKKVPALRIHYGGSENSMKQRRFYQKHKKSAKTLGLVVGAFLMCWCPFFILYLIDNSCGSCVPEAALTFLSWLGYTNSAINPIIYAVLVTAFRDAFIDLVQNNFCHCTALEKRRTVRRKKPTRSEMIANRSQDGQSKGQLDLPSSRSSVGRLEKNETKTTSDLKLEKSSSSGQTKQDSAIQPPIIVCAPVEVSDESTPTSEDPSSSTEPKQERKSRLSFRLPGQIPLLRRISLSVPRKMKSQTIPENSETELKTSATFSPQYSSSYELETSPSLAIRNGGKGILSDSNLSSKRQSVPKNFPPRKQSVRFDLGPDDLSYADRLYRSSSDKTKRKFSTDSSGIPSFRLTLNPDNSSYSISPSKHLREQLCLSFKPQVLNRPGVAISIPNEFSSTKTQACDISTTGSTTSSSSSSNQESRSRGNSLHDRTENSVYNVTDSSFSMLSQFQNAESDSEDNLEAIAAAVTDGLITPSDSLMNMKLYSLIIGGKISEV